MSDAKRWVISLAGGILVPFGYLLLIIPFIELFKSLAIGTLLLLPLIWPRFLYIYLFGLRGNQVIFVLFIIICDIILYTLITYAVTHKLCREKPRPVLPPPPPQF